MLHKPKNSFSYRKKIVLHHSLKINKLRRKINKRPPIYLVPKSKRVNRKEDTASDGQHFIVLR